MMKIRFGIAAAFLSLAVAESGAAPPLSVRDSFRIGNAGSSLCTAQPLPNDPGLKGMFDVVYSVTCRDAALPVGKVYKLRRASVDDPAKRLATLRTDRVRCARPAQGTVEQLGDVTTIECRLLDAEVGYRVYEFGSGSDVFVAEGLSGYDSALRLALRSVVADKPVEGEVSIATTGLEDPAAFARVQAGTLDPSRAMTEAYRRNNVGSYADAAEFFAAASSSSTGPISRAEALMNEALQKSNLGRTEEADSLFSRAEEAIGADPLDARRFRNYRAMHLINQDRSSDALEELDKPVPEMPRSSSAEDGSGAVIDAITSRSLNAESSAGKLGAETDELLPEEKAEILDGQALQLRGTALRLSEEYTTAAEALRASEAKLLGVRAGRVTSIAWMRAQISDDLAAIAEETGNAAEADQLYRRAVAILEANYPGSAALLSARARLAGFLGRSGQEAAAQSMFSDIVHSQADANALPPSFARLIRPYLDLLLDKPGDAAALADFFAATQLMVRPGLAQTQAVLARQLSGGTGEAARLFRQAVTLSREIERNRVALARIDAIEEPSAEALAKASELNSNLDQARQAALETQASLSSFPRYRAVSSDVIPLADLQAGLRPGEAYYRMTVVGDGIYALFVTPATARAAKLEVTSEVLDGLVTSLRDTISTVEQGQQITYAYDVPLAHKLYTDLFGPFEAELAQTTHFIFEPDGAMLRMPPNPLIVDQASVDLYAKRVAADPNEDFNFTGINWFGRDRDISTSVSPRSFVNLRNAPPAAGTKEYLGLGQNTLPPANASEIIPASADRDCVLPLSNWARPISARELKVAADILSRREPNAATVITGDSFTDNAIEERTDLDEYRIIHFATHGVVTATRPKCPTQPALLTSFGGEGSDGLLTFRDIFDLNLDADLVILSACDTAGKATALATESAGLATGGDVELDGLVRAFVGAGGRLVLASHWPVPDDFNATERLVTGLFTTSPGTPTVTALKLSEQKLMDDVDTSHPFYWAAFAVVGDGEMPIIRTPVPAQVAAR